ncbi:MAG: acetyltransferase [Candidatus Eisenbacteria bacterium]|nr:acetyltransferase [Candidatus Eisenbacteria bacterium]
MSGPGPIVIVGSGGHGRGILEILRAAAEAGGFPCTVVGFLDDDPSRRDAEPAGLKVYGSVRVAGDFIREGHRFLIGVGEPKARREVALRLAELGAVFAIAVHPRATLYGGITISPGAVVGAGATIAASTRLGEHTLVNLNATVGHDCVLEPFATVGPGANVGGNVRLGEAAFVGMNGSVLPGRSIGAEGQLGAGSVLLEDLEAGAIAFGVPARIVGRVGKKDAAV